MLEPSVKIRKFLVQFAGEAFLQEKSLVRKLLHHIYSFPTLNDFKPASFTQGARLHRVVALL
jgi:hypothetical protein